MENIVRIKTPLYFKTFSNLPVKSTIKFLCSFFLLLYSCYNLAKPMSVGSFNINSGRASALNIARQMAAQEDIDIWGISESEKDWPTKILPIINKDTQKTFDVIKGTTGINRNLLQIYYNKDKFKLLLHTELDHININNRVRAPLVAKFEDKQSQKQFLFMVNHLYRANSQERLLQAQKINAWVKKQDLPVIAVGDYNFDMSPYDISKRGPGFDAIIKDKELHWITPEDLLPSQCSSYNSILDFVFISKKIAYVEAKSNILYPESSYCADTKNSDHRPLTATIDIIE